MAVTRWQEYLNEELIKGVYPKDYERLGEQLFELMQPYLVKAKPLTKIYDEQDVIVITYGDSILEANEKPLKTLRRFAAEYL
jgi:sucrose phosphorylase